ncbi:extracellular solute-binding protein [Paenibacillus contaminans]|uniref:ABC transporter substrate-binding protein n=1 Tax=Paenibacillus contaminans TaxID=450362 RepID=A0A329MHG1_9BACL|nr:extracellular solute-binding protein [Paenibacillus contaminans]RAV18796.1 hypothetical protein DQG23_23995 [Paenibacillus contaminans]
MKKRRSKLAITVMLVAALSAATLSACRSSEEKQTSGENSEGKQVSFEPLGKFEPAIELKIGRTEDNYKYDPGQSIDKNLIYDLYEKELGVKLINEWVVPSDQYTAKSNVAISSGNIPDLFAVDGVQLRNLVEADMIEDLTEVYKNYVSEDTKKIVDEDGGYSIDAATVNGKLYAFPATTQGFWTSNVLWIRKDWLDKLGLQPPKTMDDVAHIASEFVKNNPDGVKGTYGLGVSKELQQLNGFFNGFHAYPFQWVKDGSGKTVYGGIQPEMKPALQKLADMYKAGLIDAEFGVKDSGKVVEALVSGKLGMLYGNFGLAFGTPSDLVANNPDADLRAYPMPSFDDQPAKAYVGPTANRFWVVRKGYEHPEVVMRFANFFTNEQKNARPNYSSNPETGTLYWQYTILQFNSPMMQVNEHRTVKAAMLAKEQPDEKKHTFNEKQYLQGIYDYFKDPKNTKKAEIQTGWMYQATFGTPDSGAEVLDYYFKNKLTVTTPLKVSSTPTMSQKMPTLTKMEEVLYTKIILGEAGIDEFDKFVADWKKQGGDEITKELNK